MDENENGQLRRSRAPSSNMFSSKNSPNTGLLKLTPVGIQRQPFKPELEKVKLEIKEETSEDAEEPIVLEANEEEENILLGAMYADIDQ